LASGHDVPPWVEARPRAGASRKNPAAGR
jgi:hypothetical protein